MALCKDFPISQTFLPVARNCSPPLPTFTKTSRTVRRPERTYSPFGGTSRTFTVNRYATRWMKRRKNETHYRPPPLTRQQVNDFVDSLHRHHDHAQGDKYRIGCLYNGKLVGVVQVGRPVSRILDDGNTCEVTRLCTDGTKDACSFLYAKAAEVARLLGYSKIITYILDSEPGTSLKAAGWQYEETIHGHSWNTKSRPRNTTAPTVDKKRYSKQLRCITMEEDSGDE